VVVVAMPTVRQIAVRAAKAPPRMLEVAGSGVPWVDGFYVRVRTDEDAPFTSPELVQVTRKSPFVYLKLKDNSSDSGNHESDLHNSMALSYDDDDKLWYIGSFKECTEDYFTSPPFQTSDVWGDTAFASRQWTQCTAAIHCTVDSDDEETSHARDDLTYPTTQEEAASVNGDFRAVKVTVPKITVPNRGDAPTTQTDDIYWEKKEVEVLKAHHYYSGGHSPTIVENSSQNEGSNVDDTSDHESAPPLAVAPLRRVEHAETPSSAKDLQTGRRTTRAIGFLKNDAVGISDDDSDSPKIQPPPKRHCDGQGGSQPETPSQSQTPSRPSRRGRSSTTATRPNLGTVPEEEQRPTPRRR
jgi:hypothetical protein